MLLSESELVVSEESAELELVLEFGELFTDSPESDELLLDDLLVSEFVAGADELDIEPLSPLAGAAAAPAPLEDGLDVP